MSVADCARAETLAQRLRPALILADPDRHATLTERLRTAAPAVEIPVRTSASGVRRVARSGSDAARWLSELIAVSERATRGAP